MKKQFKKNWHIILASIIGIVALCAYAYGVNFNNVRADSGWDSGYSGGGSSSSSSWSSGGSSWSSGGSSWSSRSSSSSGSYSSDGDALSFIIFIVFVLVIIYIISSNKHSVSSSENVVRRADISLDELKAILPDEDLGTLKHMAYEKFVEIQNAWMDFKYDDLKKLCTDELANSYIAQLDTLKIKNGKNVMSDFVQQEIKIIGIKKEGKMVTVSVYLRVSFYDYVINEKTNDVIRGNKSSKLTNSYELQFVRKLDNKKKEVVCPNCGAKYKTVVSVKCEYCGSTIVVDANEFVLSKKGIVKD